MRGWLFTFAASCFTHKVILVTRFNRVFSCTPLEVVLWGEQATSFLADQISIAGQDPLQIIISVGTLARSYAGSFV
jgi:hypothetical protein